MNKVDKDFDELQKRADEIMSQPGNAKGLTFEPMEKYIEQRKGKEGVKKIENAMDELGYPFSFSEVEEYSWYQESLSTLIIYLTQVIFGWDEDDVYKMGYSDPSISPILQVAIKFVSLKSAFEQGPGVWEKHYDFGSLAPETLDEENKKVTVKVLNYKQADFMQAYFRGYFSRLTEIITGSEVIESKHKECNDPEASVCDLYIVRWE